MAEEKQSGKRLFYILLPYAIISHKLYTSKKRIHKTPFSIQVTKLMSTQTEMPQGTTTFKLHRRDLNALLQFLAVETTYEDDTNEFITRTHIYDIDPGQAAEGLFRTKHALTVITNAVTDMEAQLNQSKPPTTEQTPRSAA